MANSNKLDFTKLKASWTKYDAVQVIEIIANNDLSAYLSGNKLVDKPILKSVLSLDVNNNNLPYYWEAIYSHTKQLRLFGLVAALFTHHNNVKRFSDHYSKKGQLCGVFINDAKDKMSTNIRSALVVAGASLENYRRSNEVPFDFSALFENGDVGILMKDLLKDRLIKIGYTREQLDSDNDFVKYCQKYDFITALALHKNQFERWIKGESITSEEIFKFSQLSIYKETPLLRINQWMNEWDDIDFKSPLRNKPKPVFYMFSIDARLLKRIADVHRRKIDGSRSKDTSIQRRRNDQRIEEIRKYIDGGFPWSTINRSEQKSSDYEDLKMPGLLPTAIIANILGEGEKRDGKTLNSVDRIVIEDEKGKQPKLIIPDHIFEQNDNWNPDLKPIEIIDGQHRLWAFDESQNLSGNYELPVIVFDNLDRAWQAYLFYTINIKPVKINTSLGFDLYPLLRTQSWLEKSKDGLLAYRETRAQEIVESLWSYPNSSWYQRINMIGDSAGLVMSQAAFIRALVNSFFKRSKGLYGDVFDKIQYKVLNWNRAQQAGFIIILWNKIAEAVKICDEEWASSLRQESDSSQSFSTEMQLDLAYTNKNSFLTRDQGVRGILSFANDFFYITANNNDIDFNSFVWVDELDDRNIEKESIDKAIEIFNSNNNLMKLIEDFSNVICKVDWRTSTAMFENDIDRSIQMKYRGSGGYAEFWRELYKAFKGSNNPLISKYINQITA